MKTWIIIAAIIIALGLLYLTTGYTGDTHEGFLTVDPATVTTQRQLLQAEGERRYNDLARVQNPDSNLSVDLVDAAVNHAVPTP